MTPEEKAKQLTEIYFKHCEFYGKLYETNLFEAKKSALICAKNTLEILQHWKGTQLGDKQIQFWEKVISEINVAYDL